MKKVSMIGVMASLFLLLGAGHAVPKEAAYPSVKDAEYTLSRYLARPEQKKNLVVEFDFKPTSDWKWNSKFPVQFSVQETDSGIPYYIVNEHVEMSDDDIKIYLELKPAGKKYPSFTVNGIFSFCNENSCKIFKRSFNFLIDRKKLIPLNPLK